MTEVQFPDKFQFLFQPHRFKVLYGGRGGAKSWNIARWLLIDGARQPLRILCCREIQKSIADSVHALLVDQIGNLGLGGFYTIQETRILGRNGTEFLFSGLKSNIASLKSLEGCDRVWVEEGSTVSADSWSVLVPTVRKAGSEIVISFNPLLPTDWVYKQFVLNSRPDAYVQKVNWHQNPWFPEVLRIEKDHLQATDPVAYAHVWLGEPRNMVEGAIYEQELKQAEADKRITSVAHDRTRPVHTFFDLGYGDATAIWFAQALPDGSYRVIDYLEDRGKTIADYVIRLQNKGYLYGTDWLPHDGVDTIIHTKLAGGDKSRSIEMLMRNAGRNVRIAPKMNITAGINAARTIFPQCWFDAEKCADGLQALRHYQWAPVTATGVERGIPLHNQWSDGADAFRTLATAIKAPTQQQVKPAPRRAYTETSWMG